MAQFTVAGVTAEFEFDMTSWEEIEDKVGLLDDFDTLMESPGRLRNMRAVGSIMAAEGARLGKGSEMPVEWMKENMRPGDVRRLGIAIRTAIADGMKMEHKNGEDQVVDAILAEIEKKEDQDA